MVSNINGGLILVLPTYLLNLLCSYNNNNNKEEKTRKHNSIIETGYIFQPLAFDNQGNCGPETETFLNELGSRLRVATFEDRSSVFLRQRISVIIQQYNFACVSGTLSEGVCLEDVFSLI